jgi:hypothetical protein
MEKGFQFTASAPPTDKFGADHAQIAPNRIKQGFSMGPNVEFPCAPLSVRKGPEEVHTWAVMSEKGEVNLLCWTQTGVEMSKRTIPLVKPTLAITSILQLDETGETVALNYNNARLVCFSVHEEDKLWDWEAPKKSMSLQSFRAQDCTLTKALNGFVLASISEKVEFYEISPTSREFSAILSIPVVDVSIPSFNIHD